MAVKSLVLHHNNINKINNHENNIFINNRSKNNVSLQFGKYLSHNNRQHNNNNTNMKCNYCKLQHAETCTCFRI